MREAETEATGDTSAHEVAANFSRIGWGPVPNVRRDLGTDVFVQARDSRRFDLGLFLGVQVKGGDSYFERPKKSRGEIVGWWYNEKGIHHFDAWVKHGLPHLLVLHCLETRESYWVHVTPSSIVDTGDGAKILVPANQTLNRSSLDALIEVAKTQRTIREIEGTTWTGGEIAPGDRLRFACLAPRLIAPHPNLGVGEAIDPYEAIALTLLCRLDDIERFTQKFPKVPSLEEAANSREWTWKFYAAMYQLACNGDPSFLAKIYRSPKRPERRAVATIAYVCWLFEKEEYESVIEILDRFGDVCGPVDHAWLLVHSARARVEIGEVDQARLDAALALRSLAPAVNDLTASAIRGAASMVLFRTAGLSVKDLGQAIAHSDTAVSWWRGQKFSAGLVDVLKRSFRREVDDKAETFGNEGVGHNQIYSTVLTSNFAGESGAWHSSLKFLAMNAVTTEERDTPLDRAEALTLLRRAGARSEVNLLARHTWNWGPLSALAEAVHAMPTSWSHTTANSGLALLKHAGDVLEPADADYHLTRILEVFSSLQEFVRRVTPSFAVDIYTLEALPGLVRASSDDAHLAFIDWICSHPRIQSDGYAQTLAPVFPSLRSELLSPEVAVRLSDFAWMQPSSILSTRILNVTSAMDGRVRPWAAARVRAGDFSAVDALGPVGELEEDVVSALASQWSLALASSISAGEKSTYDFGGLDPARNLAVLAIWHRSVVEWAPLLDFLRHPLVSGQQKRDAFITLAHQADRIPDCVRSDLIEITDVVSSSPADFFMRSMGELGGSGVYLRAALGANLGESVNKHVVDLLAAEPAQRSDAAMIIGRLDLIDLVPALLGLLSDRSPDVRSAAALGLVIHLCRAGDAAHDVAPVGLREALRWDGADVALRVVNVCLGYDRHGTELDGILESLSAHASALVRSRARAARASSS
jgi:hypothetical protein